MAVLERERRAENHFVPLEERKREQGWKRARRAAPQRSDRRWSWAMIGSFWSSFLRLEVYTPGVLQKSAERIDFERDRDSLFFEERGSGRKQRR